MAAPREPRSSKYPNLTVRQELVYDYIIAYCKDHPYPPTVREIQRYLKVKSTSTVHYALNGLAAAGYIVRNGGKMRTIEIIDKDHFAQNVFMAPVIGSIAAGEPILAEENIREYYPLPSSVSTSSDSVFILDVKGESMINAGILNGDYVIVEQRDTAENGEIVAALLDDSATVKRFFREADHIRLQPENDQMEPIIVKEDIRILGKIIGLIRTVI
ncbi:MAG TPA: transcriptional repressor LexA [Clostridiales bacterium]|nr:transcriptional repressor LexA [Clostridiales bacterium]